MENLIKDGNKIVGVGKLLWRKAMIEKTPIKFFAFGVLITKKYQRRGLGSKLIIKDIKEAKSRGADILYGSTSNPIADKIVKKLGFKKLITPVFYRHIETKRIEKETCTVWVLEFSKGLIKKIEKLSKFYIGTGPL